MIPPLAKVGRVIVPDLIGFGRSDKPTLPNACRYKSHIRWLRTFIKAMNLFGVSLVCHDWGGLLGLRLLAEAPLLFVRVGAMNTDLPDESAPSQALLDWRRQSQRMESLDVPHLLAGSLRQRKLSDEER